MRLSNKYNVEMFSIPAGLFDVILSAQHLLNCNVVPLKPFKHSDAHNTII